MNLKYYLRGLGIGIVVAAVLMGVATRGNETMTDAEIKERAAQLGMVEQKVLADIGNAEAGNTSGASVETTENSQTGTAADLNGTPQTEGTAGLTEEPQAEVTEAPAEAPTEVPTEALTEMPTEAPTETPTEIPTEAPTEVPPSRATDAPQAGVGAMVHLTISSGESSWTVSQNLAELGLVEDASSFDRFLSQGGYDKSIRVGEFEVPMGADYEEIAKIITN